MMSGLRKLVFLGLSVGIHLLALVLIALLTESTDTIYENIEITSYVTPLVKSSAVKADQVKQEKPKAEKVNPQAISHQEAASNSDSTITNAQQEIAEQIASDSQITTPAALITKTKANRTEAARKADYSGISQVELVVGSDGQVKNVKLRNSLPYGLDEVALQLVKQSKFKPAMINNKPVASAILFKVRFESER